MIIRIVLSAMLALVIWIAIASYKDHRGLSKLVVLVGIIGLSAVWMDSYVIAFAHWAGVGRGTDLVLYVTWPLMFFALLMLYGRLLRTEAKLTLLARSIAIQNAIQKTQGADS
jgi:small membrane protein